MGKSRKRKGRKPVQIPRQPTTQLSKPNDHKWVSVIASIVTLILAGLAGYDLFFDTVPIVEMRYADVSNPFASPFYLRNPSHLFVMHGTKTSCIGNLSVGGSQIQNSTFDNASAASASELAPNGVVNFSCGIYVEGQKVTAANLDIRVGYETHLFGIIPWHRSYPHLEHVRLEIDSKGEPHWIQGNQLTN